MPSTTSAHGPIIDTSVKTDAPETDANSCKPPSVPAVVKFFRQSHLGSLPNCCGLEGAGARCPPRRTGLMFDHGIYSITQLVSASMVGGIVSPSTFAVLRLMANSNLQ